MAVLPLGRRKPLQTNSLLVNAWSGIGLGLLVILLIQGQRCYVGPRSPMMRSLCVCMNSLEQLLLVIREGTITEITGESEINSDPAFVRESEVISNHDGWSSSSYKDLLLWRTSISLTNGDAFF